MIERNAAEADYEFSPVRAAEKKKRNWKQFSFQSAGIATAALCVAFSHPGIQKYGSKKIGGFMENCKAKIAAVLDSKNEETVIAKPNVLNNQIVSEFAPQLTPIEMYQSASIRFGASVQDMYITMEKINGENFQTLVIENELDEEEKREVSEEERQTLLRKGCEMQKKSELPPLFFDNRSRDTWPKQINIGGNAVQSTDDDYVIHATSINNSTIDQVNGGSANQNATNNPRVIKAKSINDMTIINQTED